MGMRTASEGFRRRKVSDLEQGLGEGGRQHCEMAGCEGCRGLSGGP